MSLNTDSEVDAHSRFLLAGCSITLLWSKKEKGGLEFVSYILKELVYYFYFLLNFVDIHVALISESEHWSYHFWNRYNFFLMQARHFIFFPLQKAVSLQLHCTFQETY